MRALQGESQGRVSTHAKVYDIPPDAARRRYRKPYFRRYQCVEPTVVF
jgi:hypothetical protein